MKKIVSFFQLAAFSLGAAASLMVSTGCTSPVQSKGMMPVGFKVARQHPVSVIVHTEGSTKRESGSVDAGLDISAPDFRQALVAAINESRAFSSVREQAPADYRLSVSLVRTKIGGAATVSITESARWQLTRLSDNSIMFNEFITASGMATMGDAIVGGTRARIALERAGKENIKQGLIKLSELDLR